jgi:hypothetical protein
MQAFYTTGWTNVHPLDREEYRFFAGLYPHQIEGIAFLNRKGRAILGDDMGLGKPASYRRRAERCP